MADRKFHRRAALINDAIARRPRLLRQNSTAIFEVLKSASRHSLMTSTT
jgi:hypothetical protein